MLAVLGLSSSRAAAPALTAPDAAAAMHDFLAAYWDADKSYFLAWNRGGPFSRPSGAGPQGGQYSDFWWEAQLWDLVLDAAQRDPANLEYQHLIDAVYDGFQKAYPDWQNDFNDDLGWWAQASMRAYKITQQPRYLERAKTLFADIWTYWNDDLGGGVLWRRSGSNQKNVATNGPLVVIAVRLYQATGDASYLERARRLYDFLNTRLTDGAARVFDNIENGTLRNWDFTYNIGNFALAATALREVSDDAEQQAKLLTRAVGAMDWGLANLTNAGVLLDEGTGDGGGFKGVMLRSLKTLADATGLEPATRERYLDALRDNATQIWNSRRAEDGLVGSDWASVQGRGVIESLAAASAVTALQLAPEPLPARVVTGNGRYESENSTREGVSSSVTAAGFSGRGYINNFVRDGQFVEFRVNAPEAGAYRVALRYSAGGGAAIRALVIEDGAAEKLNTVKLEFAATPNWQTWAELTATITLPAGSSHLRVLFDKDSGSRNWLNLDALTLGVAR